MIKGCDMKKCGIILIALLIGLGFVMIPYDELQLYKSRRDFSSSPEPSGKKMKRKKGEQPIFVIQKHDASHLHYDFRIEIDGVLKSWAIPKGPSTDPHDKRLAVPTEDHPMDYAHFEGVIPEGHYGAGPVLVWDIGTFENIKQKDGALVPMKECYKNGQIEIFLHGKKLEGGYALIRTDYSGEEKWLCIKMNDEYADARRNPVSTQPESALSGKTIEEIAQEGQVTKHPKKKRKK
jgi:DNA ligase D-like protein (predicted 3'-phosphoesterase)